MTKPERDAIYTAGSAPVDLDHFLRDKPEKDPREATITKIIDEALAGYETRGGYVVVPKKLLARLDAADPIRQVWPEVVGALEVLEWIVAETAGHGSISWDKMQPTLLESGILRHIEGGFDGVAFSESFVAALAKAREIEGGGSDES